MNPTKNFSRVAVAAALLSVLALPVTAQVTGAANTAANTAAQASTAAQAAAARPIPVPPTTAAQTAAQQPQATGVINGSVAGSAAMQADTSGVAASGAMNNNAAIAGQTPMTSARVAASGSIAASLSSANTVAQINGAAFQARDGVVTQIDSQVSTANRALGTLRGSGRTLTGDASKEFDVAYMDAREKERQLKQTLSDVRNATDGTWAEARAKLASDYDAYTQAVARAEAAAQAGPTANP